MRRLVSINASLVTAAWLNATSGCVTAHPRATPATGNPSVRIDILGAPRGNDGKAPTNRDTIYQR